MQPVCQTLTIVVSCLVFVSGCGSGSDGETGSDADLPSGNVAYATIKNDFNNPEMAFKPPWTICRSSYMGVDFGAIALDATSPELPVTPGIDNVLMVAAWNDPTCSPAKALPIASKNPEEIVTGQHRTIAINLPNHQGACPPEGVAPIPEELYNRILALWPEFGFLPYAQKAQNTQCLPQ
jgi:hypothetical protein